MKATKLTREKLEKIIEEEKSLLGAMKSTEKAADETEEVDAKDFADTLAKHIDYAKALKLEETRLKARMAKVRKISKKIKNRILNNL